MAQSAPQPDAIRVTGVAVDTDGAGVAGAHVTLRMAGASTDSSATTDSSGRFALRVASPGPFTVTVRADGFGAATTSGKLAGESSWELGPIKLTPATNINVDVNPLSQQEIAEEQIHAEEKQRIAGLVPNFFVTYTWTAAPLTRKQKFELAWKTTIDPVSLLVVGGSAGVEQAENHFEAYRQGAAGYGKRFGAGFGDFAIGTFAGGAVFPSLLHQDPRYFYKGTGSFLLRAGYALSTAFICKGDNGHWQPNYSGVLGDLAGGAASNLYYPANDRTGASLTIENGLLSAAFDGVGNLLQEFVFHRFTPGLAKTKPLPAASNP